MRHLNANQAAKKLIAQEPVNTGRQAELDIARGLAVLFMVLVHVQAYYATEGMQESPLGVIVEFVGGIPAAPVFMFLLGIGINYTRKSDPAIFIKRGLGLIATGYALNLARAIVPYLVQWAFTQWRGYLTYAVDELIFVDILQFAGLAMVAFGLIKRTRQPYLTAAITGGVCALLNFAALQIKTDAYLLSALTGLVWGSNESSFFPFLTWAFYPLAGFLFGALLIRATDKRRFYRVCLGLSALTLAFAVGIFDSLLGLDIGMASESGYYHHTLWGNIVFTAFVVCWISVLYFLTLGLPDLLAKPLLRWSANVTPIYFIHWVLIGVGLLFVEFNTLDWLPFVGVSLVITLASDGLAVLYQRWAKSRA